MEEIRRKHYRKLKLGTWGKEGDFHFSFYIFLFFYSDYFCLFLSTGVGSKKKNHILFYILISIYLKFPYRYKIKILIRKRNNLNLGKLTQKVSRTHQKFTSHYYVPDNVPGAADVAVKKIKKNKQRNIVQMYTN